MTRTHIFSLLLALACTHVGKAQQNNVSPGLELVISQKMFNLASHVGVPILLQKMSGQPICQDDSNGDCCMKGACIKGAVFNVQGKPDVDVQFSGSNQLSLHVQNFDVLLTDLKVSVFGRTTSGTATATGSSMSVKLSVSPTDSGSAQVSTSDLSFQLPSLHFKLDNWWAEKALGPLSSAIEFVVEHFYAKSTFQDEVDKYMNDFLQKASYKLLLEGPAPFDQDYLDFHVANVDGDGSSYMRIGVLGAVNSGSMTFASPDALPQLTTDELHDHMVLLEMGHYTFDTSLQTFHEQDALTADVNASSVPGPLRGFLNTDFYKHLFPALYAKYPHASMTVRVATHPGGQPPKVSIVPGGNKVVADMDFTFYVDSDMTASAFALTCPLDMAWNLSVSSTSGPFKIVPQVVKTNVCDLRELSSNFGNVGPQALSLMNDAVLHLFEYHLLGLLNKRLGVGLEIPPIVYPTPSGKVTLYLEDAVCDIRDGYALVGFNVSAGLQDFVSKATSIPILI